jgi:cytochrome o ubiquinol oxidase subunit III
MIEHAAALVAANEADEVGATAEVKAFGFWIYLMSDAIVFALLFATFTTMSANTARGPSGRALFDLTHTFVETILLLASSTTFGCASVALKLGQRSTTLLWLCVTFLLGASFVGMEISEFQRMIAAGAGPDRSGFLSAFFTLVGTHGLHVSIGLIWIVVLGIELAVRGPKARVVSHIHRLGLFWHFLDIVWIGIFSIVYLPGLR